MKSTAVSNGIHTSSFDDWETGAWAVEELLDEDSFFGVLGTVVSEVTVTDDDDACWGVEDEDGAVCCGLRFCWVCLFFGSL